MFLQRDTETVCLPASQRQTFVLSHVPQVLGRQRASYTWGEVSGHNNGHYGPRLAALASDGCCTWFRAHSLNGAGKHEGCHIFAAL